MANPSHLPLRPLLLRAEPRRDGSWEVHYRLADGRTGWVLLTDGNYHGADHAELAEALRRRLPPPPAFP